MGKFYLSVEYAALPEFYAECTAATEEFMLNQAVSDEKWRKQQDPAIEVIDPLTGQLADMRFQAKNVRNHHPGSNHDVPKSNHDENGETVSEQVENPTPGLLQEDRTCMAWRGSAGGSSLF